MICQAHKRYQMSQKNIKKTLRVQKGFVPFVTDNVKITGLICFSPFRYSWILLSFLQTMQRLPAHFLTLMHAKIFDLKKTVWMRWTNNRMLFFLIATSLKIHHFGFPLLLSIGVQCNASKNKFGGKKTLAFSTVCERGEKSLPRRDLIPVYARPSPPLGQGRRNRGCNPPAPTNFGSNTSRQDLEPCLSKVLGLFLAPRI